MVANSLYSEKEVFCRELVSNAADALEKLRHAQQSGVAVAPEPLEIHLSVDPVAKTLTVQDFGIGMTRTEMVDLLGTIARFGASLGLEG
jgi:HSP90 family molecular chaperone